MDYLASMFQADQRMMDEFHVLPVPCHDGQQTIHQVGEFMILIPPGDATVRPRRLSDYSQRRRKAGRAFGVKEGDIEMLNDNNKTKKIIHRDIERQRRQEMATLCATLRSLIPFEFLKGKRSISDHMNEAVNYIKHLQEKILKLSEKRDGLRKSSNSNASSSVPETPSQESSADTIFVRPCLAGMEVVISTCLRQGLQLSTILEVIVVEGLSVISCTSTEVNKSLTMHIIVCEVKGWRTIEPSELQHKLTMLKVGLYINLAVLTK